MTEVTARLQFSSKRYDTFACTFPLNGNHVYVTFKLRRDSLPITPLKMNVKFEREKRNMTTDA